MDQLTLFRDEEVPIWKPPMERLPAGKRAGTALDHRWTTPIYAGSAKHGLLDTSQRLYQGGGEAGNFIYWRDRLVSFDLRVWEQIKDKADWIEMLDHDRNEVWRIAMQKAIKSLTIYEAGIGKRIGVPMDEWSIFTGTGHQVK